MIIFKCKFNEGFIIKILIEILSHNIGTGCFEIGTNGINLCTADENKCILINTFLDATSLHYKFAPNTTLRYYDTTTNKIYIGITLSHFHSILSPLKKKDSLEIFIDDAYPMMLQIRIIQKENLNTHVSTASVTIQAIRELQPELPDETQYKRHTIIPSSDYHKIIKNMIKTNNVIDIYSRGCQMEFSCSREGVGWKKHKFGEEPEEDDVTEFKATYRAEFFSRITKLSGICSDIHAFPGYPLKLKTSIGLRATVGYIEFYIKSLSEIDSDERALEELDYDSC